MLYECALTLLRVKLLLIRANAFKERCCRTRLILCDGRITHRLYDWNRYLGKGRVVVFDMYALISIASVIKKNSTF